MANANDAERTNVLQRTGAEAERIDGQALPADRELEMLRQQRIRFDGYLHRPHVVVRRLVR